MITEVEIVPPGAGRRTLAWAGALGAACGVVFTAVLALLGACGLISFVVFMFLVDMNR